MYFLDLLIAASAGALVGLLIGRRNSRDGLWCQELEAELAGVREGAARYREEVATHFSKTSELVRGLTLQYRAVYDHLADGARTLCPEGTIEIAASLAEAALPVAAGPIEANEVDSQLDLELDPPDRWAAARHNDDDDLGPLLEEDALAPPDRVAS